MSNYSDLVQDIKDWLMRDDLASHTPTFIRLAEADFNRQLRTRQMVKRSQVAANDRYLKLPSDWRRAWNIQRASDDFPLTYLTPAEMDKERHRLSVHEITEPDVATYYSLFGDSIELLPAPTAADPVTIEMLYYAKVPALTDQVPENWLIQQHYDIYLYGALIHSAPFLKEDERVPVWKELYNVAIEQANIEDANAKRSGTPLTRPIQSF